MFQDYENFPRELYSESCFDEISLTQSSSTRASLTAMLLTLSLLATALMSLTNSMTLTKANLIVKRISLDISLTNVMTLTRCWAVFHITSTTMLSLAICLCAITISIMVTFSVDKSFANNKKIGSRLDADFAVSNYNLCYSNTFASGELKLSCFFA